MNFVEAENARVKLATYSATYSGMKSHFLKTLIKFGALNTKMILNLISRIILKAMFNVNKLGTGLLPKSCQHSALVPKW